VLNKADVAWLVIAALVVAICFLPLYFLHVPALGVYFCGIIVGFVFLDFFEVEITHD